MSTKFNVKTKTTLAKLLSAENISVHFNSNMDTASFDVNTRVLSCPMWADMENELYDLFMAHEVGHALYTPPEGWHSALTSIVDNNSIVVRGKKYNKVFKSYLNIIEDVRIEKLIKNKYSGMARQFSAGYNILWERGFFGVGDINKHLPLIDRINVYFKMSHTFSEVTHEIPFRRNERRFLAAIREMRTWEDAVNIATELYTYAMESKRRNMPYLSDFISLDGDFCGNFIEDDTPRVIDITDEESDSDDEPSKSDDSGDHDRSGSSSGDGKSDDESTDSDDENDDENDDGADNFGNIDTPDDYRNIASITDESFRRMEKELCSNTRPVGIAYFPELVYKNAVITNEKFTKNFIKVVSSSIIRRNVTYPMVVKQAIAHFKNKNDKIVSQYVQQFNMKKRAKEYARTHQSPVGELDMNKLHQYKYSSDIFKKMDVTYSGKSHGMIVFLDMSGSMLDIFADTVNQLLVLSSFCSKVNIPFDVYGFTSGVYHADASERNYRDAFHVPAYDGSTLSWRDFDLIHLIGSSMGKKQFDDAFGMLSIVARDMTRQRLVATDPKKSSQVQIENHILGSAGFSLGNTPLTQAILASRYLIDKFKKTNNCDIINVVHLTDGEGNNAQFKHDENCHHQFFLIDRITNQKKKLFSTSQPDKQLTEFVSEITGCKHIAFRMHTQASYSRVIPDTYISTGKGDVNDYVKSKIRDGFVLVKSVDGAKYRGYDRFFHVMQSKQEVDHYSKLKDNCRIASVCTAFKKNQEKKMVNMALVSRFIDELSVGM